MTTLGDQIFVSVHHGKSWPPRVLDLRASYDDTIGSLRQKILNEILVSDEANIVLFLRKKELKRDKDDLTLSAMEIHTGFSITVWDLTDTEEKDIWPLIKRDGDGRRYIV